MNDVGEADAAADLENAGADGADPAVEAGTDTEALADVDDGAAGGAGATAPPGHKVNVKSLSSGHTLVRTSSGKLYAASHLSCPAGQSTTTHDG